MNRDAELDQALRVDVRVLGDLLGEVLRQQAAPKVYETVERIREQGLSFNAVMTDSRAMTAAALMQGAELGSEASLMKVWWSELDLELLPRSRTEDAGAEWALVRAGEALQLVVVVPAGREPLLDDLYAAFSKPEVWKTYPETRATLVYSID